MNEAEKIAVDVGKAIEWPFVHAFQLARFVGAALKDEPKVKDAVTGLMAQIEAVTAQGAIVIAADGLNLPADLAELAAAQTLFAYVVNVFVPAVSGTWKDLGGALAVPSPIADLEPSPLSEPIPGPGLHTQFAG